MSKTKTLSLNISERLSALAILNSFKGDLDKLSFILEDIKLFGISEEEWEAAGKTQTPVEGKEGTYQLQWDNEKGGLKDITVNLVTSDFIKSFIKEKSDKGELGIEDNWYLTLFEKAS